MDVERRVRDRRIDDSRLSALLFDPAPVTHLGAALSDLAGRVRSAFGADLALILMADDEQGNTATLGASFADPRDEALFAPMIEPPGGLYGVANQVGLDGESHVWSRLLSDLSADDLTAGTPRIERALHSRLANASGIGLPLATPNTPSIGSVCVFSFDAADPLGAPELERLTAVRRQLSLTVRNNQWRDRNRRARRVLQAVLGSTPNGILVTDTTDRLMICNEALAALVGVDVTGQIGHPMADVNDRIAARMQEPSGYRAAVSALREGRATSERAQLRTLEGTAIAWFSAPISDDEGEVLGRVEIFSDTTHLDAAVNDARRAAAEAARLRLIEERRAREAMGVARAAHVMASARQPDDVLTHLAVHAESVVPCDVAIVLALDRTGAVRVAAVRGINRERAERAVAEADPAMATEVCRGQHPVLSDDVMVERPAAAALLPEFVRSLAVLPILGGPYPTVLLLGARAPRRFTSRELRLLTDLSAHAGLALRDAGQAERDRHVAETLQQALLPDALPSVPGLTTAGLYRASAGALVGGDFYGGWTCPDGGVAVIVGDVSGKGVEASGLTAMVRYAAEGLAYSGCDPAQLMSTLNGLLLARTGPEAFVALTIAIVDLDGRRCRWTTAGLPPALRVDAEGALEVLEDPGPPCGALRDPVYRTTSTPFAPGDLLFISSDGLIEARRDEEPFGEARLHEAVRRAHGRSPRDVARQVYAEVYRWARGSVADDVAIAVMERTDA